MRCALAGKAMNSLIANEPEEIEEPQLVVLCVSDPDEVRHRRPEFFSDGHKIVCFLWDQGWQTHPRHDIEGIRHSLSRRMCVFTTDTLDVERIDD